MCLSFHLGHLTCAFCAYFIMVAFRFLHSYKMNIFFVFQKKPEYIATYSRKIYISNKKTFFIKQKLCVRVYPPNEI